MAISISSCTRSGHLWGLTAAVPRSLQGTVWSYFVVFVFSFFLLHVVAWGNDSHSNHPHISSLCRPSETNPLRFPRPAPSRRDKPWGLGKGSPCPGEPTNREPELTPVANLHLSVDFIKQGRGTRGKNPLEVFLLVPTLHLRITTFPVSAVDVTEHKVCVSEAPWLWPRWERVEVMSAVHAHESYTAVRRARSFALR